MEAKSLMRFLLNRIHIFASRIYLILLNPLQVKKFYKYKLQYQQDVFSKSKGINNFVDTFWVEMENQILSDTKNVKLGFFNEKSLIKTMTSSSITQNYLPFIEKAKTEFDGSEIKILIKEDVVGGPRLLLNSFLNKYGPTSINRVVHLYQLSLIKKQLKHIKEPNPCIVEWGGGFGGLARLFWQYYHNMNRNANTYIIIDLPIIISLQSLYLKSTLGDENIKELKENDSILEKGKINLVSINLIETIYKEINCDLFISAWAISESSVESQQFVKNSNFFNSKFGIIIYQPRKKDHQNALAIPEYISSTKKIVTKENVPVYSTENVIVWKQ